MSEICDCDGFIRSYGMKTLKLEESRPLKTEKIFLFELFPIELCDPATGGKYFLTVFALELPPLL